MTNKKKTLNIRHNISKYIGNVILRESEGYYNIEILRSLRSLRMTGDETVPSLFVRGQNFLMNVVNLEIRERVSTRHFEHSAEKNVTKCHVLQEGRSNPADKNNKLDSFGQALRMTNKVNELINLSTYPLINFKPAFTLAEVLITLSIVGVIAILTIPSIIKNYRYKAYAASLQKTYSQITDAVQAIMNDEMTTDFSQTTASVINDCTEGSEKGPCYFLRNYFKVANECGEGGLNTPCTGESYKSFFGDDAQAFGRDFCIKTTNGATICMGYNSENQSKTLFLDINGPSAPNITGLDTFVLQVQNDGSVVDWSGNSANCNVKSSENNNVADYASGCFTQVMNNGWILDDTKWVKTEEEDDDNENNEENNNETETE